MENTHGFISEIETRVCCQATLQGNYQQSCDLRMSSQIKHTNIYQVFVRNLPS